MERRSGTRKSIRIEGYDYRRGGTYFVTICTYRRQTLFGAVRQDKVKLSSIGGIAKDLLLEIPDHFNHVQLDEFVVMPNHLHAILFFDGRGTTCRAPTEEAFGKPVAGSLPTVIRSYKGAVTKACREAQDVEVHTIWQRGYYETIIRSSLHLYAYRRYILHNPGRWRQDRYHEPVSS